VSCRAVLPDVERFRAAIIAQIGLQFDDAKLGFLGEVLQRRLDRLGRSADVYLRDLEHQPSNREITRAGAGAHRRRDVFLPQQ